MKIPRQMASGKRSLTILAKRFIKGVRQGLKYVSEASWSESSEAATRGVQ